MAEAKKARRIKTLADLARNEKRLVVMIPRLGGTLEIPVRFCSAAEKERLDALVPLPPIPTQIGSDLRPFLDDTNAEYRAALMGALERRRDNFAAWVIGPEILGDLPLAEQVAVMKSVLTVEEIGMVARQGVSPLEVTEEAVREAEERIAPFVETTLGA